MLDSHPADDRFVPSTTPADVAVIIVNYNTGHLLPRCVGNLRAAIDGLRVQLVIVDNASRDDSVARVRASIPDCTLIANAENVGFGRANNQALASCNARYVVLLNADAYVFPDTLRRSVAHMDAHPRCGVLGAHLVDEAGQGLFSGRPFPRPGESFLLRTGLLWRLGWRPAATPVPADGAGAGALPCDWVVGCYYVVRRRVLADVGLFDPRYFLYFEEVDHCRAVHAAGWTVECLTDARVVHVGGGSAETEGELGNGRQISVLQLESSLLYYRKHDGVAGVLWTAALSLLTEMVLAAKWLVARRDPKGLRAFGRRAAEVCRLMVATRAGSFPTR